MKSLVSIASTLLAVASTAACAQITYSPVANTIDRPASGLRDLPPAVAQNYGKLPMSFERNQGQAPAPVHFLSRGSGYSVALTDRAAILSLPANQPQESAAGHKNSAVDGDTIRMECVGASHHPHVEGLDGLPGIVNYFPAKDPTGWHTNIHTFAKVRYTSVYPGVDLVYYGNQSRLEYDFVVAPRTSPDRIRLLFSGARNLALAQNGNLMITGHAGTIAFQKPVIYQVIEGVRRSVQGEFTLVAANTLGFRLGKYDHDQELVIDPVLAYSTYVHSISAQAIAVDHAGNVVLVGTTELDLPGGNVSGYVPYVQKLNTAGSNILYTSYLGNSYPNSLGVALDAEGNAYLSGAAKAGQWPTTPGAFQSPASVGAAGFVTKLNPTGSSLIYSTLIGGSGIEGYLGDGITAIAVDTQGKAFVTGYSWSRDFPVTSNAPQAKNRAPYGSSNAFCTELNAQGSDLVFSTYLGGNYDDAGRAITVAADGSVFVVGTSYSTNFPTTPGAFQRTVPPSSEAAFVTKYTADGSALAYSTYLGGDNAISQYPTAIAVDAQGHAYVTGQTSSQHFPTTPNAFQKTIPANNYSAFVSKLNIDGSGLIYSTYLTGSTSMNEYGVLTVGSGIQVEADGSVVVAGSTTSNDFPVTPDAFQRKMIHTYLAAFLTRLNAAGSELLYSTYLGGSEEFGGDPFPPIGDSAMAVALDRAGNAYVSGTTTSLEFPLTAGVVDKQYFHNTSGPNGFVSKFAFYGGTTTTLTSDANPHSSTSEVVYTAQVTAADPGTIPGGTVTFAIDNNVHHVALDNQGQAVFTTDLPVGVHDIRANYLGAIPDFSSSGDGFTQLVSGKVSKPTFPAIGGTFKDPIIVRIQSTTRGSKIYYTTDGTTPTTSSTLLNGFFDVAATTTVKAIAALDGATSSDVATATFRVNPGGIISSTALTSSANPVFYDAAVTFTAVVTAASGPAPTGTVTFYTGSTILGTSTLVNGTAKLLTFFVEKPGLHVIKAHYTGTTTIVGSYGRLEQQVNNRF